MRDIARARLGGKHWKIQFVPKCELPRDWLGECNHEQKVIKVAAGLDGPELFDTLHHELMHAAMPWLSEEFVHEASEDMTRAIYRIWGEADGSK